MCGKYELHREEIWPFSGLLVLSSVASSSGAATFCFCRKKPTTVFVYLVEILGMPVMKTHLLEMHVAWFFKMSLLLRGHFDLASLYIHLYVVEAQFLSSFSSVMFAHTKPQVL